MTEKKDRLPDPAQEPERMQEPGKTKQTQEPKKTETLLIPLDPNGNSDSVYLCVNGRNMIVKRGEPVEVPPEFAEVYRNAQVQQLAAVRAQRAAMSKE